MTIPPDTLSLADYERYFHARIEPSIAAYIDGYAADGISFRANAQAFADLKLLPRHLRPLKGATTQLTLLGDILLTPILIAPMAYHRLVHPQGELATAKAAALTGHVLSISTQASVTLEEIAQESQARLWFQLYPRRAVDENYHLLERAAASGYRAIIVTVDAPVSGVRNHEQRAGFALPADISAVNLANYTPETVKQSRPGSPIFQGMLDETVDWDMLKLLVEYSKLPILVKGIAHQEDAAQAVEIGVDGIIVSNHGGRVLDSMPAAIELLGAIVQRVGDKVPVLLDGGIRRGTDVVKALALGATAVMIGRPVLHALAVGGVAGVVHMLTLLQTEFEMAMALCGCATVEQIGSDLIWEN